MRFSVSTIGDLGKLMSDEIKAAEKAVTAGILQATEGLKTELRTQVTSAGLGPRLARTWRSGAPTPSASGCTSAPCGTTKRRRRACAT